MKTQDLKIFFTIVDAKSLTKAASDLALPKSNLTRRMQNLEQELEFKLFSRHNRTLVLTPAGQTFYEQIKPLVQKLDMAIDYTKNPNCELNGNITISLNNCTASSLVTAIKAFTKIHPQVTFSIYNNSPNFDLALAFKKPTNNNFKAIFLNTKNLAYVASPTYINESKKNNLNEYKVLSFAQYDFKSISEVNIKDKPEQEVKLLPAFKIDDESTYLEMLISGLGIGLVDIDNQYIKNTIAMNKLTRIDDLKQNFTQDIWAISATNLSLAAQSFTEFLNASSDY